MIVVIGSNGMRIVGVEHVRKCFRISPSYLPLFFFSDVTCCGHYSRR